MSGAPFEAATANGGKSPYPLIELPNGDLNDYYYYRQVWMGVIHNMMIRALNSIERQSGRPKTEVQKNSFVGYILCLCIFVKGHHDGEETIFFPECEKRSPGSMTINVEQHQAFEKGIDNLKDYCEQVQSGRAAYAPAKIGEITRGFGSAFVRHLHDEIDTLGPKNMKAIFPKVEEYRAVMANMLKWSISRAPKAKMLPWMLSHHDVTTAPWYPSNEIPGAVIFVVKHVVSKFNGRYHSLYNRAEDSLWPWSPCDLNCHLKTEMTVA